MYIKYLKYIILPAGNSYKIESYCLIDNLENFINKEIDKTICFVIYSEPILMFFNEELFNSVLKFKNSDNTLQEVIMIMKKIEINGGTIIK